MPDRTPPPGDAEAETEAAAGDGPSSAGDWTDVCVEVELKLAGGKRKIARAARAARALGAQSRQVQSVYYDTADRRLRAAGFTLRRRAMGERYELTLKQARAGAIVRGEWTALVDDATPDPRRLPPEAPVEELALKPDDALIAVFETHIERLKYEADLSGAVAEVAIDRGRIVGGGGEAPVREIELELKRGAPAGLLAQARALAEAYGLWLSPLTKADRGFALADARAPAWVKAERPELSHDMTAAAAFARILNSADDQIRGNIAAAVDGRDPEGVRQLRIALRRLRAALGMFGPALGPAAADWRSLAGKALNSLGVARDLDVFLAETLPPVVAAGGDRVSFATLAAAGEAAQEDAYRAVRRMLRRRGFTRLALDVAWAAAGGAQLADDRPITAAAAALLDERRAAALALGADFAELDGPARHRARVAVRRLRYALDFFASLYPGEAASAYLRSTRRVQADLGAMNDAAVATVVADRLVERAPVARAAAAAVKDWHGARRAAADRQAVAHWSAFAETPPFWAD